MGEITAVGGSLRTPEEKSVACPMDDEMLYPYFCFAWQEDIPDMNNVLCETNDERGTAVIVPSPRLMGIG